MKLNNESIEVRKRGTTSRTEVITSSRRGVSSEPHPPPETKKGAMNGASVATTSPLPVRSPLSAGAATRTSTLPASALAIAEAPLVGTFLGAAASCWCYLWRAGRPRFKASFVCWCSLGIAPWISSPERDNLQKALDRKKTAWVLVLNWVSGFQLQLDFRRNNLIGSRLHSRPVLPTYCGGIQAETNEQL